MVVDSWTEFTTASVLRSAAARLHLNTQGYPGADVHIPLRERDLDAVPAKGRVDRIVQITDRLWLNDRICDPHQQVEVQRRVAELHKPDLRRRCIEHGIRLTPSQPRPSKSGLEKLLKNRFYVGEFSWRGRRYDGKHPPIISRDLFSRIQGVLAGHNKPRGPHDGHFAFRGLLTCGHCGCLINAERKKGRYVYYHCTGAKGKCNQPWVREEALAEELGAVLKGIQIDAPRAQWIRQVLLDSHSQEKEFHRECLADLRRRYDRLQEKLEAAYDDKLEGKISEDFWLLSSDKWREEQRGIMEAMGKHERANQAYLDEGLKILELAQAAYALYLSRPPDEQRKLLDFVISNCTLESGKARPVYRRPFCWIAEGVITGNWLPGADSNHQLTG